MTPGKIGCQLRADGADVEVGPRCTAIEQQQPCALQVLHFGDAREQLTVVRDDLGKFPFNEFLPPQGGAQNGDSLLLKSVLVTAPPMLCTATVRSGVDTTYRSSRKTRRRYVVPD